MTVFTSKRFFYFCCENTGTFLVLAFIIWNFGFLLSLPYSQYIAIVLAIMAEIGGIITLIKSKRLKNQSKQYRQNWKNTIIILCPILLIMVILISDFIIAHQILILVR